MIPFGATLQVRSRAMNSNEADDRKSARAAKREASQKHQEELDALLDEEMKVTMMDYQDRDGGGGTGAFPYNP